MSGLRSQATGTSSTNVVVSDPTRPINVYHVKQDQHVVGWIVLSFILAAVIIALLFLWMFCILDNSNIPPCNCFGPFGVEINVDAHPLNQCGTDRSTACIFKKNSLSDCVIECDNLQNICKAFTFNPDTATMKIVNPTGTFTSSQTNLFVRQSGTIS